MGKRTYAYLWVCGCGVTLTERERGLRIGNRELILPSTSCRFTSSPSQGDDVFIDFQMRDEVRAGGEEREILAVVQGGKGGERYSFV